MTHDKTIGERALDLAIERVAPLFCFDEELVELRKDKDLSYLRGLLRARTGGRCPEEPGRSAAWEAAQLLGVVDEEAYLALSALPIPAPYVAPVHIEPEAQEEDVRDYLRGQERFLALVLAYAQARGQVDPDWSGIHAVEGSVVDKDEDGVEIVRIPLFYEEYLEFPLAHLWADVTELEPIWRLEGAPSIEYAADRKAKAASEEAAAEVEFEDVRQALGYPSGTGGEE